ncbi:MAG: hypothetical protein LBV78_04065, partial [Kitasatospora sp.]|nr:hypothetical protein [Kitasatospora sp.]
MTPDAHVTTVASGCHLFNTFGCGYPAPGLEDFEYKPIFSIGPWHVTKPELLMVIVVVVVVGFVWAIPVHFWCARRAGVGLGRLL